MDTILNVCSETVLFIISFSYIPVYPNIFSIHNIQNIENNMMDEEDPSALSTINQAFSVSSVKTTSTLSPNFISKGNKKSKCN